MSRYCILNSQNHRRKLLVFLTIFLVNVVLSVSLDNEKQKVIATKQNYSYSNELDEHTLVTENGVFPYVVAILKKSNYLCAGALINEKWVVTAADALYFLRETARLLRVRLGSVNNKKGGLLLPIKLFEIHPYFSDARPEYDIALVKLAHPVAITATVRPIVMQTRLKTTKLSHFTVPSWLKPVEKSSKELQRLESMEAVKRRRILTVSRLHRTDAESCSGLKEGYEMPDNITDTVMCLDPPVGDSCNREAGAPVIVNGMLWGVMASWKSEDCDVDPEPWFVTVVAAPTVRGWMHATINDLRWNPKKNYRVTVAEDYQNDDDDDDYDDDDDKLLQDTSY